MSPHRMLTLALLALGTPVTRAAAQADSAALRRGREVVALINGATAAAIAAYADSAMGGRLRSMPGEAHVGFMLGMRRSSQGLDWISGKADGPRSATVVLRRRVTGDPLALGVEVESEPPYRVAGIGQRPVPPGAVPAPLVPTDAAAAAELGRYLDKLVAADLFSGAVLLAHDGKVVFAKAYGEANKDFHAPNRVDTKFNLGSMNKMFTAVAIAQLAEAGKLSYDDSLARFLPDFPNPEAARKIRIKHLLSHTSGLGSYFNEAFDRASRARFRTVDDMMELAKGETPAFEPGTRWSYSNTGMLVLGKVIEVAGGQNYFDYIREHVYRPAGMTASDAYQLDEVNPNLAVGYEKEIQADGSVLVKNNLFMHVIRGGPAGGGYSTVEDLLRFAEALGSGRLVGKASVETLTTAKPELSSPGYGYGFTVEPGGIVGHSGGFPGISSNLDIFKGTGWVAVVQANYGGASMPVVEKMRALVRARIAKAPPATGPTSRAGSGGRD